MNESDLIIKAATLLAKDLIVDGSNIRKTLLKLQSNQQAAESDNEKGKTDEDIEYLLLRKFLPKKRNLNTNVNTDTKLKKKSKSSSNQQYQIVPSSSSLKISPIKLKVNKESRRLIKNSDVLLQSPPTFTINNKFFNFLEQCDDKTFENQFKFTKKTFMVYKLVN